jgi:hypothetical protein
MKEGRQAGVKFRCSTTGESVCTCTERESGYVSRTSYLSMKASIPQLSNLRQSERGECRVGGKQSTYKS